MVICNNSEFANPLPAIKGRSFCKKQGGGGEKERDGEGRRERMEAEVGAGIRVGERAGGGVDDY